MRRDERQRKRREFRRQPKPTPGLFVKPTLPFHPEQSNSQQIVDVARWFARLVAVELTSMQQPSGAPDADELVGKKNDVVPPHTFLKLCREGKVESWKRGREYVAKRSALVAYVNSQRVEVKPAKPKVVDPDVADLEAMGVTLERAS